MPKLGLGLSLPQTRISGSAPLIPASGLSLWLKADAGVTSDNYISYLVIAGFTGSYTGLNGAYEMLGSYEQGSQPLLWNGIFYISGNSIIDDNDGATIATNNNSGFTGAWTPTSYLSTITLSGAGTGSVNGVYTRGDTLEMTFNPFVASGGRNVSYDDEYSVGWVVGGPSGIQYISDGPSLPGIWHDENGAIPNPTAVTGTSTRSIGSPTTSLRIITNAVYGWTDQSVGGRDAQPSNGFPSLTTIGANPFIQFTAGVDMFIPPIWEITPIVGTILSVVYFDSTASRGNIFSHTTDTVVGGGALVNIQLGRGIGITSAFYLNSDSDPVTNYVISNVNVGNTSKQLLEATFNTSQSSLYLNGASCGSGSGVNLNGTSDSYIGGNSPYSAPYKIGEVIIYNRVLTTPERQQVEAYLNAKYAIY